MISRGEWRGGNEEKRRRKNTFKLHKIQYLQGWKGTKIRWWLCLLQFGDVRRDITWYLLESSPTAVDDTAITLAGRRAFRGLGSTLPGQFHTCLVPGACQTLWNGWIEKKEGKKEERKNTFSLVGNSFEDSFEEKELKVQHLSNSEGEDMLRHYSI